MTLRAPFPWFGGKSRVAPQVWERFGDVPNYVEPFAGSLAVLLGRPTAPRIETVNDLDCFIANFWRAVKAAPDDVAVFADWPINEADLHARHRWLVGQAEFREQVRREPEFFDAKIAGWWVWGICQWIGAGWCSLPENGPRPGGFENAAEWATRPNVKGMGVHTVKRVRDIANAAEWEKRPNLARGGRGVHMTQQLAQQLPKLGGSRGAAGAGVHASALTKKMPRADRGTASRLATTGEAITAWMRALQDRLRMTRVVCGDWTRVLGRSVTECIGVTAVFLDPPYSATAGRDPSLYAHDDGGVAADVRAWALANGSNPKLRIALCGYAGEHDMPADWECVAWKATGGYASAVGNHENARRERIWFSPHCRRPSASLFDRLPIAETLAGRE